MRVLTADLSRGRAETMATTVAWLGFGSFDITWQQTDRWRVVSCDHISATTYLRFAAASLASRAGDPPVGVRWR